jgi:1-acyl-sn-glycerol-3-phosphate acyltransferase
MLRYFVLFLAVHFFRFFFWLTARVEVIGRENIPPHGPYLVIANHFSQYEIPLIGILLPQVPRFFAAQELSQYWLMRLAMWTNDSIPVRRGQADRQALRRAFHLLEEGHTLAIFPKGALPKRLSRRPHAGS